MNPQITLILLAAFLALAFSVCFWALRHYKNSVTRSYQLNELGINDPVGQDLRRIAARLAEVEEETDINGPTPELVRESLALKKELVKIGREIRREESQDAMTSSCEQQI